MPDIIPDSAANRLAFFTKLKQTLHDPSNPLAMTATELTAADGLFDPLTTAYQRIVDANLLATKASGDAGDLWALKGQPVRKFFDALKSRPTFPTGLGDSLSIFSQATQRADADIKPRLTATSHRGGVTLDGSKDYAETVNLYMRRAGETEWKLIAIKRKRLPFEDQLPPLKPGVPEIREYLARGVNGDDEVGQESDIVTATFTP